MINRPVNEEQNPTPLTAAEWIAYRKECEA